MAEACPLFSLLSKPALQRQAFGILVLSPVSSAQMGRARKVTVEVPPELLEKAQLASGTGITQTIRTGLQLVAASQTYAKLLSDFR